MTLRNRVRFARHQQAASIGEAVGEAIAVAILAAFFVQLFFATIGC